MERYQGSDQKTIDSELTALLTEELIGNEQFIDKVVAEQPNIAMRIVKKIQNLIKLFKMSGEKRAEYKVLTLAENMYLRSAYDHGRQNLIQIIEQGREDNKQVQVDEQNAEVGVDQTLALQYNKKRIYKQIPKQEYAIISSRIMEDNSRYRAREEELPRYGAARSANYFYVYENFALGNFGVLKQIKITDANQEYIASIEAKIGENNGESIIGSTSELNRVLEVLKSQARRNRRNNALDSEGRADSYNGGIPLGESESDGIGHSQKGNGNKQGVRFALKDTVEQDVLAKYGKTYRWAEAGYILKDGTRLDLSGRNEGASGGYRTVDHRDIFDIYEDSEDYGTDAMNQFMARGNIRVMPESPGINLQVEPTEEQYRQIQDLVERLGWKEKYFSVDFDDANGDTIDNITYEGAVSARKVVSDIKYFFKEGSVPHQSELSKFRYSLKDSQGNELSQQQAEYFRDSKVRDEQGNLLVVYHGSKANATVFKKEYISSWNMFGRGYYFTSSKKRAERFAKGSLKKVYLNIENPFFTNKRECLDLLYAEINNTQKDIEEYSEEKGVGGREFFKICYYLDDIGVDVSKILQDLGFDGVYDEGYEDIEVVAYESNQIKLTTNLNPTSDQDIRYALKDKQLSAIKNRGIIGDRLLNVQDLAETILEVGGKITEDGKAILYHATNAESAKKIRETGKMIGRENRLYFSTKKDGEIKGYGNSIVEVTIPLEMLELNDYFSDEVHLTIETYPNKPKNIRYSLRDALKTLGEYDYVRKRHIESREYDTVSRNYDEIVKFIMTAQKGNPVRRLHIGTINDNTAKLVLEKTGVDIKNYDVVLASNFIAHIFESHGKEEKEKPRGQKAVDYNNIEDVLETILLPDDVTQVSDDSGTALRFEKYSGQRNIAITITSNKKSTLTLKSAWIISGSGGRTPSANTLALAGTSKTNGRSSTNNSISKIEENVNTEDKNTTKFSRKSPAPSQAGDIIKARGNLTTDKIFTKDEAKKIIAEIEERLVFEEKGKIGTVKGTNELIDRLWKGLNKADKGEYTRVGVEIADYVIKNSVVEDMYECLYGDVEVDEAREVIKTLKQYFHKVKISDRVLGEIKYHFDDKAGKVLSLWRAKEGGLANKINNDTKSQTVLAFFCNERVGVVWRKRLSQVE